MIALKASMVALIASLLLAGTSTIDSAHAHAQREQLRDLMRAQLPCAGDGSITYSACAIAGKAQKHS